MAAELSGRERFIAAQRGLPDRVPTMLGASIIEPYMLDPKYNWRMTVESPEANIALAGRVCELFECDVIIEPIWLGQMHVGACELGTVFRVSEDRVPYAVEHPIKSMEDVQRIALSAEPTGYLKMYLDTIGAIQRRFPQLLLPVAINGPWDLAMLLRGDEQLPFDMRVHKDYVETDDPVRKEKIRGRGDPDIYPAIMELTTRAVIRHFEWVFSYGLPVTIASMVDQYAASPIMSRRDFVQYVLPYIERVWLHHERRVGIGYYCASPMEMRKILETEPAGVNHQISWSTYIFPTTPEGISLPEYDRSAFELAREYKRCMSYVIHGKFLRDAADQDIEALIRRVCTLATEMRTSITLLLTAVPPGTDLGKINYICRLAKQYGEY